MSFGNPPMPARIGGVANELCDILVMSAGVGDGGVGVGTYNLTYSGIPCVFQTMSSSESFRYGTLSEQTLYEVFLPTISQGGTDITVVGEGAAWHFEIAGTRYEAISAGVKQGDGMQKIALRRVGAA